MKHIILSLLFNSIIVGVFAQRGVISGSVKEAKTQEGIVGATVRLDSLQEGAATDLDGNFEIKNVPAGLHSITITFVGMAAKIIPNIRVEADKVSSITTELEDDSHTLETVVVKGQRVTNTEVSVVSEVKQLPQIAVGVSGQLIQKTQDRDAAGVVRRIPGVSIFDDRFVVVRGLNERYNTVMLNDIITPSTEVDSKAFSFDMIPSSAIDRMLVFKSASADLPGDISGGAIKIYTKTVPDGNTSSLQLLLSYRNGTTFKNADSYHGSKTDWMGFDDGLRQLPDRFPSRDRIAKDPKSEEVIKRFRNLPDYYNVKNENVLPDLRLNYNISHRWFMGNKELTNTSYIAYTRTSQEIQLNQQRFQYRGVKESAYQDEVFTENVRAGVMNNWALILNPKHKIEFRNLFNQMGIKETVIRNGYNENVELNGGSFRYEQRSIYSGQFNGTHDFNDRLRLKWIGGLGYTYRLEPDYRRYLRSRPSDSEEAFKMSVPQQDSPSLEQAARSYSDLSETVETFRADVEYKFKLEEEERFQPKLSFGTYLEYKDRIFENRWYGITNGNRLPGNSSLLLSQPEQFFKSENLSPTKLYYGVGTNYEDKYAAQNLLAAGYAQVHYPITHQLFVTAGLRGEFNHQQLQSRARGSGAKVVVDNPIFNPLPSVNAAYNFAPKQTLRLAYSQTLNRPEFRELAPFTYYDFVYDVTRMGYIPERVGDKLKNATVHNYDVRYEFYPSESEYITVALFDKEFENAIENKIRYDGSGTTFTVTNAPRAYSRGVEVEVRKTLTGLGSTLLNDVTLIFNGALIKSDVVTGTAGNVTSRSLQGQSPYLVNLGVFYNGKKNGWQANMLYNVIGKRIFVIGDTQISPNVYEMPRHVVDLNLSKQITSRVQVRLTIQDLFNQPFRLIQDTDVDNKITSSDGLYQHFKKGNYTTIGINYNLY